jgi:hypothetical protein
MNPTFRSGPIIRARFILLCLVLAAIPGLAQLLIYEDFNYERRQGFVSAAIPGEGIDGLNGGVGFAGPWTTTGNYFSGIPVGPGDYGAGVTYGNSLGARLAPLAYSDGFGNHLVTRGHQLRTAFGNHSREVRRLASPVGGCGNTLWMSFLAQAHGLAGTSRYAFVELANADGNAIRLGNVTPVSSGQWGVQVLNSGGGAPSADLGLPMDVPTLFLARLAYPPTPGDPARLAVWLNPHNLVHEKALPAPIIEWDFAPVAFDQLSVAGRYSTDFDELRLGTRFDAVTPTQPAPVGDACLTTERDGQNLRLSWPEAYTDGLVPQVSLDLQEWQPLPLPLERTNGQWRLTVPLDGQQRFFRLHYPAPGPSRPRLATLEATGWQPQEVRAGLVYYERQLTNLLGSPQVVNVLALDLDHPGLRLELTAMDVWGLSRVTVPVLAEHAGAVAAINGGFGTARTFSEVGYGIMIFRGIVWPFVNDPDFHELYEAHGRNAVGIDAAGEWHFASRGAEGWEVGARWPTNWPGMVQAMAGGSQLVRAGAVHPLVVPATTRGAYLSHSGLHDLTFNRNPRTAIGITNHRIAVLVTVAGRFPGIAEGMTLQEMAELMLFMGCRDALELDGGGSSTMWIGRPPFDGVVNYPTDNGQFDHDGPRSLRLAVLIMETD